MVAGICVESGASAAGAECRMASTIAVVERPTNARRPVNISYSTTPNEKISVRPSSGSPSACSGDM